MERKIKVTAGDVTLQLTLNDKLLAKPFDVAVLTPFLKAYSKRTGEAADLKRVARVEVDEEMLGDHSIAASVILLARETVSAEVFLRPLEVEAAMRANELVSDPFAAPPDVLLRGGASAGGRTVHAPAPRDISQDKVEFDEDNMTPIERLKKERREARAAREQLEAAAAAGAVLQDAPELAPGARVRVEGLTSAAGSQMNGREGVAVAWKADKERMEIRLDGADGTVNVKPANLVPVAGAAASASAAAAQPTPPPSASAPPPPAAPPAAPPPSSDGGATALNALEKAETRISQLGVDLRELASGVSDLATGGTGADADGSFRAAARQMLSTHVATINQLMAGLDELSLGEIADASKCAAARARKKAAATMLEHTLLPQSHSLRRQLDTPRDAGSGGGSAPAAPLPDVSDGAAAPKQAEKQSLEIDSDED